MKIRYFIFSLIPLVLLFSVSEVVLRVIDFRYSDTPLSLKYTPSSLAEKASSTATHKLLKESLIIKDKNQFWVPAKDLITGKYSVEKEKGVVRIATLGCSCTYGCFNTQESYPSILEKLLNQKSGGAALRYEVLNAGVGSYSSYQGLQRLKHAVLRYRPDILTIFFGWNDHWVSQKPDKEVRIRSDWEIYFFNLFERFRVFQALNRMISIFHQGGNRSKNLSQTKNALAMRVSPQDYESNLKEIVRIARENKIQPVLATAPADNNLLEPSWVWPFSKDELIKTHAFYNQIVRKVALESRVPLIDLEVEIVNFKRTSKQPAPPIFSEGVHYTPFGCQLVAKIFFLMLHQLNLLQ